MEHLILLWNPKKQEKKIKEQKIEKNGDATDGKFGALSVVQR